MSKRMHYRPGENNCHLSVREAWWLILLLRSRMITSSSARETRRLKRLESNLVGIWGAPPRGYSGVRGP